MKSFIALLTVVVAGSMLNPAVMADDVEGVKAEMLRFFEALNSGDVDGFLQHYIVGNTSFVPEGGLLRESILWKSKGRAGRPP